MALTPILPYSHTLRSLPGLQPHSHLFEFFLKLHVLGVGTLDMESLFVEPRACSLASFFGSRSGPHDLAVFPERLLYQFGSLLDAEFKLGCAFFQTLWH